MSVKVYENGAWTDTTDLYIYENGVWRRATSVKAYENGEWVEKFANYNNVIISLPYDTSNGFSRKSSNYVKCIGNNITGQVTLLSYLSSYVNIEFVIPQLGAAANLQFDIVLKSIGTINSTTYPLKLFSMWLSDQRAGSSSSSRIIANLTEAEHVRAYNFNMYVEENYTVLTKLVLRMTFGSESTLTTDAGIYFEINNLKVDGVPYGVNTIITP